MSVFNKTNKFGRYCVEAIIPGWGSANIASGSAQSGMIRGVGRRQVQYPIQQLGAPTAPTAAIDTYPMMGQDQWGNQARWIENKANESTSGFYFADAVSDLGPISPACPAFTVIGIVKLIGNGTSGTVSDPRIWTKDIGGQEVDHDLMIGFVRHNGNVTPRTRVRIGTTTQTVFLSGSVATDVVDDGWHLVAATVKDNGGGTSNVTVHGLYPDGRYTTNTANPTGTYNPRTTTTEGMFATVGSGGPQNISSMGILGVWFFEGAVFNEGMLREFWKNPWQTFAPQQFYLPMTQEVVTITQEPVGPITATGGPVITKPTATGGGYRTIVKITDVNTTETWQDGATGITISGTGFT